MNGLIGAMGVVCAGLMATGWGSLGTAVAQVPQSAETRQHGTPVGTPEEQSIPIPPETTSVTKHDWAQAGRRSTTPRPPATC